jgi:hypothetical protein
MPQYSQSRLRAVDIAGSYPAAFADDLKKTVVNY